MGFLLISVAYLVFGVIAIESCRIWLGLRFADDGDFTLKFLIWPITLLIGLILRAKDPRP